MDRRFRVGRLASATVLGLLGGSRHHRSRPGHGGLQAAGLGELISLRGASTARHYPELRLKKAPTDAIRVAKVQSVLCRVDANVWCRFGA